MSRMAASRCCSLTPTRPPSWPQRRAESSAGTSDTVAAGQAIAIMDGETALKAEIDRILAEMEADGTIQKLLDQYGIK